MMFFAVFRCCAKHMWHVHKYIYEYTSCINLCKCFQHEEAKGLYYLLDVLHKRLKLCCHVVLVSLAKFALYIETSFIYRAEFLLCSYV